MINRDIVNLKVPYGKSLNLDLRSDEIRLYTGIQFECWDLVWTRLDCFINLTALDIICHRWNTQHTNSLCYLISFGRLESLALCFSKLGTKDIELLGNALSQNSSLIQLDLSGNELGSKGCEILGNLLGSNQIKVRELWLTRLVCINDGDLRMILQGVAKNSHLRKLDIWYNNYDLDCLPALADCILKLEGLDMSHMCVPDGFDYMIHGTFIEQVIARSQTLQTLRISAFSPSMETFLSNIDSNVSLMELEYGGITKHPLTDRNKQHLESVRQAIYCFIACCNKSKVFPKDIIRYIASIVWKLRFTPPTIEPSLCKRRRLDQN